MARVRRNDKRRLHEGKPAGSVVETLPASGPSREVIQHWDILAKTEQNVRELLQGGFMPPSREEVQRVTAAKVMARQREAKRQSEYRMGTLRLKIINYEDQFRCWYPRLRIVIRAQVDPENLTSVFITTAFIKGEPIMEHKEPFEEFPSALLITKLELIA